MSTSPGKVIEETDYSRLGDALLELRFTLKEVQKTSRGSHDDIATTLHPITHLHALAHTTDKKANLEALMVMGELDRLVGNLGRQFTSRADDECADFGASEEPLSTFSQDSVVSTSLFQGLLDVLINGLDTSFNRRDEEAERFACPSLSLDKQVPRCLRRCVGVVWLGELRQTRENRSLNSRHVCQVV